MTTRDPQDRSLLNESNAPTRYAQRSVGPVSLAAIWFAMAIQVAIFIAAGQLTASFQVWQVIVAIAAGCTIAVVVVFFTQSAAIRWGISFIRWMNIFAAPVFRAMGVFMVYLMLDGAGVTLGEVMNMGGETPGLPFSTAVMIFVGGWIAVVVSIHDIVKECKVAPTQSGEGRAKGIYTYWHGFNWVALPATWWPWPWPS